MHGSWLTKWLGVLLPAIAAASSANDLPVKSVKVGSFHETPSHDASINGEGFSKDMTSSKLQTQPDDWGQWKWATWPIILYLFWAQSFVCDEFFVPSVQVFSETFNIPENVAGATVMALGCNGPELFVNVVALFITHSDIGVGTIVGSDVFNLLLISGGAVLSSPVQPLKFQFGLLARDLCFYAISIILLLIVLIDGIVTWYEALLLGMCVVAYAVTVTMWSTLESKFSRRVQDTLQDSNIPLETADVGAPRTVTMSPSALIGMLKEGGILVDVHPLNGIGRLQSRCQAYTPQLLCIDQDCHLRIGAGIGSTARNRAGTADLGTQRYSASFSFTFGSDNGQARQPHTWMTGQQPVETSSEEPEPVLLPAIDIVDITPSEEATFRIRSAKSHLLGTSQRTAMHPASFFSAQSLEQLPTEWKFRLKTKAERDMWVSALQDFLKTVVENPMGVAQQLVMDHREVAEGMVHHKRGCRQRLSQLVEWFCFPVVFSVELTVPECHNGRSRRLWPVTLVMSMVWLAFFSYVLCSIADKVSVFFSIPSSLIGLTIAAAGTSFPNLVASILVAKRGQSSMAIANAIGSNIQNVFLALGWPWFVKALCSEGLQFKQSADGIISGVIWMAGTLVLFVVMLLVQRCELGKCASYILLITYIVFCGLCNYQHF